MEKLFVPHESILAHLAPLLTNQSENVATEKRLD